MAARVRVRKQLLRETETKEKRAEWESESRQRARTCTQCVSGKLTFWECCWSTFCSTVMVGSRVKLNRREEGAVKGWKSQINKSSRDTTTTPSEEAPLRGPYAWRHQPSAAWRHRSVLAGAIGARLLLSAHTKPHRHYISINSAFAAVAREMRAPSWTGQRAAGCRYTERSVAVKIGGLLKIVGFTGWREYYCTSAVLFHYQHQNRSFIEERF